MSLMLICFLRFQKALLPKTTYLRADGRKILLVIDIYSAQISHQTLTFLLNSDVIVAGLPTHSSFVLKSLDVGFLGIPKSIPGDYSVIVRIKTHETKRQIKCMRTSFYRIPKACYS